MTYTVLKKQITTFFLCIIFLLPSAFPLFADAGSEGITGQNEAIEDELPDNRPEESPEQFRDPELHFALLITTGDNELMELNVDPSLRLSVDDGNLIVANGDEESVCFELKDITGVAYRAFYTREPDIIVSADEIIDTPRMMLSPTAITIENQLNSRNVYYIHRTDGSLVNSFHASESLLIDLRQYSSGVYILSGGNIAPLKFHIR